MAYLKTSNTATTSTLGCPFHRHEVLTSTKPMHRVVDTPPTEHTFSVPYDHVIPFWQQTSVARRPPTVGCHAGIHESPHFVNQKCHLRNETNAFWKSKHHSEIKRTHFGNQKITLKNRVDKVWKSKNHFRCQTDKFWKSKRHFRNQNDKFWK